VEPAPGLPPHPPQVWADAVYTGSGLAGRTATLKMTLCIVAKRDRHARVDADA
jgi:hypothetical protein